MISHDMNYKCNINHVVHHKPPNYSFFLEIFCLYLWKLTSPFYLRYPTNVPEQIYLPRLPEVPHLHLSDPFTKINA